MTFFGCYIVEAGKMVDGNPSAACGVAVTLREEDPSVGCLGHTNTLVLDALLQ